MKQNISGLKFLLIFLLSCNVAIAQNITTVAGTGVAGFNGNYIPAISAELNIPAGIVLDPAGNLYIADNANQRVRKVSPSGIIKTIAGNTIAGYTGDGGIDTVAQLNTPRGLAMDLAGNLYIADANNHCIRKINTSGIITTIAGNGIPGFYGDNGPAASCYLNFPSSIACDASGNIYVSDLNNQRIRKIASSGIITTIAGTGVQGYNGDNILAINAQLNNPTGIATDAAGDLYIADEYSHRVRKIDHITNMITTIAGTGNWGFNGDGGPATNALLSAPYGVCVDPMGNVYIAEYSNQRIRKVTPSGIISTVVGNGVATYGGDGGPASSAQVNNPVAVITDANGNLYIDDQGNNRIRKMVAPPSVTLTVSPSNIVCASANIVFTATASNTSSTTFQWVKNGNVIPGVTGSTYSPTNLVTGDTIYCNLTSSSVWSNHIGMTIKPIPSTPTASGNSPLCPGATLNLQSSSSSSHIYYGWTGPNTFASNLENPSRTNMQSADSGIYSVVAIDSVNQCPSFPATVNIVVNSATIPTVTLNGPSMVCHNALATYLANTNVTNASYQWRVNNIITGTNSSYAYTPLNGDHIYCKVTVPSGTCFTIDTAISNTLTLSVVDTIAVSGSIAGDSAVCHNALAVDSVISMVVGASYDWKVNGTSIGVTSPKYYYAPTNGYLVSCQVSAPVGSCYWPITAISNSLPMAVSIPLPSIYISGPASSHTGDSVFVNAILTNAGSGYSILWKRNQITIGITSVPTIHYLKTTGNDTITAQVLTHVVTCTDTANSNIVNITNLTTGIENINEETKISIYPNPFNENIHISGLQIQDRVVVFDLLGRQVVPEYISDSQSEQSLFVNGLASGTYIIQVRDMTGHKKISLPLIKQ
ncbi:MAG: T9SS type A sorting domain-containing protein [Bacteroidota bacterium]